MNILVHMNTLREGFKNKKKKISGIFMVYIHKKLCESSVNPSVLPCLSPWRQTSLTNTNGGQTFFTHRGQGQIFLYQGGDLIEFALNLPTRIELGKIC